MFLLETETVPSLIHFFIQAPKTMKNVSIEIRFGTAFRGDFTMHCPFFFPVIYINAPEFIKVDNFIDGDLITIS